MEFTDETVHKSARVKDIFLNIATVGGHRALTKARDKYEEAFSYYEDSKRLYSSKYLKLQSAKSTFDSEATNSFALLKAAKEVAFRLSCGSICPKLPTPSTAHDFSMSNVDRVIHDMNVAMESSKGLGMGSGAAIGSWLLVTHLGTASTGVAINGLAGAASTNAALAWFGGGALAAGGGGMVLGGIVLSGIVLLPTLAFGAYRSYKKASQIEEQLQQIITASSENNENAKDMELCTEQVDSASVWLAETNSLFSAVLEETETNARKLAEELARSADLFAAEISTKTNC